MEGFTISEDVAVSHEGLRADGEGEGGVFKTGEGKVDGAIIETRESVTEGRVLSQGTSFSKGTSVRVLKKGGDIRVGHGIVEESLVSSPQVVENLVEVSGVEEIKVGGINGGETITHDDEVRRVEDPRSANAARTRRQVFLADGDFDVTREITDIKQVEAFDERSSGSEFDVDGFTLGDRDTERLARFDGSIERLEGRGFEGVGHESVLGRGANNTDPVRSSTSRFAPGIREDTRSIRANSASNVVRGTTRRGNSWVLKITTAQVDLDELTALEVGQGDGELPLGAASNRAVDDETVELPLVGDHLTVKGDWRVFSQDGGGSVLVVKGDLNVNTSDETRETDKEPFVVHLARVKKRRRIDVVGTGGDHVSQRMAQRVVITLGFGGGIEQVIGVKERAIVGGRPARASTNNVGQRLSRAELETSLGTPFETSDGHDDFSAGGFAVGHDEEIFRDGVPLANRDLRSGRTRSGSDGDFVADAFAVRVIQERIGVAASADTDVDITRFNLTRAERVATRAERVVEPEAGSGDVSVVFVTFVGSPVVSPVVVASIDVEVNGGIVQVGDGEGHGV